MNFKSVFRLSLRIFIILSFVYGFVLVKCFTVNVSSVHKNFNHFRGRQDLLVRSKKTMSITLSIPSKVFTPHDVQLINSLWARQKISDESTSNSFLALEDATDSSTGGSIQRYSELIGIYDADGSLMGEIKYIFNKIVNDKHCSLCDITHGSIKEKDEFKACKARLPVPLRTIHLDEQDEALKEFTSSNLCVPCVVGRKRNNRNDFDIILNDDDLQSCNKSVDDFEKLLQERLENEEVNTLK